MYNNENIFNFYLQNNSQKYIKEKNELSIASNKILSCIVAIGYDSECYDINFDLKKTIQMIILKDLNYSMLSNKQEIEKLINELKENKTEEAIIANECINITNKISNKSINTIIENLYNKFIILSKTPRESHQYLGLNNPNQENVLDHIYGTLLIAFGIENEYHYCLNYTKLYSTLLLHETDEIILGDNIMYQQITNEDVKLSEKAEFEVLSELRKQKELVNLINDFRNKNDITSEYAFLINKLEYDLQVKIYQIMGAYPVKREYNNEKINSIINRGMSELFDIQYEYDKANYISIPCLRGILEKAKKL